MLTADIRRDGAPIGPEATCAEARLQIADGAPAIAIVDRAERALGLVSRAALFASPADRPITAVAEADPLCVETSITLADLETKLLAHPAALAAGFLLVENGRYAGIGDSAAALQTAARNRAAARDKMDVALRLGAVAIWRVDWRKQTLFGADTLSSLCGRPVTFADVAGQHWLLAPEAERAHLPEAFGAARTNAGRFHFQHSVIKDGELNWVRHHGLIEFDEAGAPLRASMMSSDMSRAMEMISVLEAGVGRMSVVLEESRKVVNRIRVQMSEPARVAEPLAPRPVIATPRMLTDRVMRWLDRMLAELEDRNRIIVHALDQAEQANSAKTQFLASVSHELRTPLNAILGYSEILEEDLTAAKLETPAQDAQRIRGAARHLLHLINGLLDLSKIEAGKMDLAIEKFDVREAISETLDTIRPLAQKAGNRIDAELAGDLGLAETDRVKLSQCLLNLLSNACKFTKGGEVSIKARRENNRLVFEIADTGIGMTEAQAAQIFQPFVQAEGLTTHRFGGTGLGLAITRRLALLLGGDVAVTSAPGQGSVFTLWAPANLNEMQAPAQAPTPDEKSHDRLLALIVDADADLVEAARRGLNRLGFGVRSANSTEAALSQLHEARPSVVLLGAAAPGQADLSLLELMKADAALRDVPVIVLAAIAERERALALGACAHVAKPVDHDALAALAVRYADFNPIVGRSAEQRAASAA